MKSLGDESIWPCYSVSVEGLCVPKKCFYWTSWKKWTCCSISGYFGDLRRERSKLVARVLAIYTNLRPERSERLDRFFCYFHEMQTSISGHFFEFVNRKEWTSRSFFFSILTKLRQERNDLIARFGAIFTNLRPKRNELIPRYFNYFHEFKTRRGRTYLSIFGHFLEFEPRKERTYCSIFDYFHDFETSKEWTYCSTFTYFHQ